MDLRKKAIMETQFAWIFILIVGAVILVFFVGVSKTQRESAEVKSSGVFSKEFDAILAGIGVSVGTSHKIFLPEIDILMDCDTYTVGFTSNNLENRILFAPEQIKGDALVAWTVSWNAPFKVANLILLTGSDLRYFIVDDGLIAEDLFDSLPNEMTKELITEEDIIIDLKNYKTKFIFINKDEADIENSILAQELSNNKRDVTAINFKMDSEMDDSNEVEFYKFNGNNFELEDSSLFFGENSKFAAIFAQDAEFYTCSMEKAFKRLSFISLIHYKRAEKLAGTLSVDLCESTGYYDLENLQSMSESAVFTVEGIANLEDWGNDIESNNEMLMQKACPPIY